MKYYLGIDVNTDNEAEWRLALDKLREQKDIVQGYVMDEIYNMMESGEASVAAYYAGDYLSMLDNNEDLAFVIPEEGSNWFVDAMCVLKDAPHKEEAEAWINFIASTEANLANMDYIWYASPNAEALEQYPDYYLECYEEELDPETYEEFITEKFAYINSLPGGSTNLHSQLLRGRSLTQTIVKRIGSAQKQDKGQYNYNQHFLIFHSDLLQNQIMAIF